MFLVHTALQCSSGFSRKHVKAKCCKSYLLDHALLSVLMANIYNTELLFKILVCSCKENIP